MDLRERIRQSRRENHLAEPKVGLVLELEDESFRRVLFSVGHGSNTLELLKQAHNGL